MDPQAERIGAIRRPRILDSTGKPPEGMRDADLFDPGAVGRMRAEGALYSDAIYRGEPVRVYTSPAERMGQGWVIQLARELRDYRELARVQWLTILTVLPLGVALAALGGRFLTARAMRPIAAMGEEAARIGAGEFGRRVAVEGNDEFAELGLRFNEMAESLGLSFAQQQAAYEKLQEAFEQQRRFVADASHELRTPLTRLQLTTSAALEDPSADLRSALNTADDSARAMAKLVGQLLDLAQADAGALRPFREELDLRALAADVVSALPVSGAPIRVDSPDHPVIAKIDPMLIGRALTNLLENALRHTPTSGNITVTVAERSIAVSDTGEGIPPEHLARVRERFYRVDTSRTGESGGTGLGLAIVDEIMRAHGGSLQIESEAGQGTRATLRLP
jgi:two-component system OmpR family sensor kinase